MCVSYEGGMEALVIGQSVVFMPLRGSLSSKFQYLHHVGLEAD